MGATFIVRLSQEKTAKADLFKVMTLSMQSWGTGLWEEKGCSKISLDKSGKCTVRGSKCSSSNSKKRDLTVCSGRAVSSWINPWQYPLVDADGTHSDLHTMGFSNSKREIWFQAVLPEVINFSNFSVGIRGMKGAAKLPVACLTASSAQVS